MFYVRFPKIYHPRLKKIFDYAGLCVMRNYNICWVASILKMYIISLEFNPHLFEHVRKSSFLQKKGHHSPGICITFANIYLFCFYHYLFIYTVNIFHFNLFYMKFFCWLFARPASFLILHDRKMITQTESKIFHLKNVYEIIIIIWDLVERYCHHHLD